jgi:hypothetical protein
MAWKNYTVGLETRDRGTIQTDPYLHGIKRTRPKLGESIGGFLELSQSLGEPTAILSRLRLAKVPVRCTGSKINWFDLKHDYCCTIVLEVCTVVSHIYLDVMSFKILHCYIISIQK